MLSERNNSCTVLPRQGSCNFAIHCIGSAKPTSALAMNSYELWQGSWSFSGSNRSNHDFFNFQSDLLPVWVYLIYIHLLAWAEPWRQILAEHVKEQGSLVHVLVNDPPRNDLHNQNQARHLLETPTKKCIPHRLWYSLDNFVPGKLLKEREVLRSRKADLERTLEGTEGCVPCKVQEKVQRWSP